MPTAEAFLTGLTSSNGGIPLVDYLETDDFWGKNSYSGDVATINPIVSVTQTPYFGKAYTLKPMATNRVANVIIAQGFLVGSSRFQNEDVDYINRIILARSIAKNVIPQ